MVRIGEALTCSASSATGNSRRRWRSEKNDRSVPLGELLVRMGVVSREDLQLALARKMGYPLVDLDTFPAEAEALRKLSYAVAMKLKVMPLLVRDGRPRDCARRPGAAPRGRRGRVQRVDEGRAGARAQPLDRGRAARCVPREKIGAIGGKSATIEEARDPAQLRHEVLN